MTRRFFDHAFKLKAVKMSYQRDNVRQLAQELGIVSKILYRWHTEFVTLYKGSFPGNGKKKMTKHESEIARLKKELNYVRIERDILKKAFVIELSGLFFKAAHRILIAIPKVFEKKYHPITLLTYECITLNLRDLFSMDKSNNLSKF